MLLDTEDKVRAIADEAESMLINTHNEDWQHAYQRIAHGAMMLFGCLRQSRLDASNQPDPPFLPRPEDDPQA